MKKRSNIKKKIKDQKKYYSKTDIFLSRMASILRETKGNVNKMFRERAITSIRLNPLKNDTLKTYKKLKSMGFDLEKVEWLENTYIVTNADKSDLGKLTEYDQGWFYIQNLASMIPPLLLMPTEKEKVLDMCAAPGSKTTQLSEYMHNKGRLVANDVDTWRLQKLKDVLFQFGATTAQVRDLDGIYYGKQEKETFDKILLDAPCSGEGMIYLAKMGSLRFWNIKKVKGLSKVQQDLIVSAYNALKPGGLMVYSTCTLEPEENEGVITRFLTQFPNAQILEVPLFNTPEFEKYKHNVKRGILNWNGKAYNHEVSKTYRILPGSEMMGFYIALIKKGA